MRTYLAAVVKGLSRAVVKITAREVGHPRLAPTGVSQFNSLTPEVYDAFDCVDDCILAAFDHAAARLAQILGDAASREACWVDRLRAGITALLAFFDEEPVWARFLILETSLAGNTVAERRNQALSDLAGAIRLEAGKETDNARTSPRASELTAELIVGGAFSVLRTRMLAGARKPFAELAPSLIAFALAPYQGSRAELVPGPGSGDEVIERGMEARRLPVRTTYRTTRVLSTIGDSPGLSNREIAEGAGLSDEGQTSKLLRRLERRGLVENVGLGQSHGGPNAWLLTRHGERVLTATRHSLVPGAGAVIGRRVRGAA